ncbi:hypothetical protein F5X96DRAFT_649095 [Biscogniauxia mediterranea]|nr:hypothetical protein F5X96DRAFT_649095 [Biscogniauxia mediterranea]
MPMSTAQCGCREHGLPTYSTKFEVRVGGERNCAFCSLEVVAFPSSSHKSSFSFAWPTRLGLTKSLLRLLGIYLRDAWGADTPSRRDPFSWDGVYLVIYDDQHRYIHRHIGTATRAIANAREALGQNISRWATLVPGVWAARKGLDSPMGASKELIIPFHVTKPVSYLAACCPGPSLTERAGRGRHIASVREYSTRYYIGFRGI